MTDMESLFVRQAAWQRSRAGLSWGDKLRQAVILREAQLALMKTPPGRTGPGTPAAGAALGPHLQGSRPKPLRGHDG